MTGEKLAQHRAGLGLTQEGMAGLQGCSLIGYKRFASDSQPNKANTGHARLLDMVLAEYHN